MAITSSRATSYIAECLAGVHLTTDTYKALLIKAGHAGTYNKLTANVGTPGTGTPSVTNVGTDEAAGTGYTSGGITLGAPTVSLSTDGLTARLDFPDIASIAGATLSADGIVIYNSSKSGKVVGVFSFGGTVTSTAAAFDIAMPAAGDSTSLIRIS
jgi:hypothetical protein